MKQTVNAVRVQGSGTWPPDAVDFEKYHNKKNPVILDLHFPLFPVLKIVFKRKSFNTKKREC